MHARTLVPHDLPIMSEWWKAPNRLLKISPARKASQREPRVQMLRTRVPEVSVARHVSILPWLHRKRAAPVSSQQSARSRGQRVRLPSASIHWPALLAAAREGHLGSDHAPQAVGALEQLRLPLERQPRHRRRRGSLIIRSGTPVTLRDELRERSDLADARLHVAHALRAEAAAQIRNRSDQGVRAQRSWCS